MENINVLELNQPLSNKENYNSYQMILPLELEKKIDSTDPVHSFLEVMEGVNWNKYLSHPKHKGRDEYNPFKMLKIILFAYMNKIYSLRKIEAACKTDIRFMYLMQEETPSHMAIHRFIQNYLKDSIENIFKDIFESINQLEPISRETIYIDGTKLEANANKFTFIWKKTAIKTRDKTFIKLNELADKITDMEVSRKDEWTIEDIERIENQLLKQAEKQEINFVYGKGKRKTVLQRQYDELLKHKRTLSSCLERIELCGPHRNSCSKTDHDATMMHMKEDYYMKTGIFKAGYNVQIAVSDEYIQYTKVYQDRADQKTFMKFMDGFKRCYGKYPKTVVADAGYGSYDNYFYCLEHNIDAYIKYGMYSKEKETKFKKKKYNKLNWEKKNGRYICPNGNEFNFISESVDKRGKYYRINQTHSCGKCAECPLKKTVQQPRGIELLQ